MATKLDSLEPKFRIKVDALIKALAAHGIMVVPTSCRRTIAEQDALYAQGRTTKGSVVTNAKGGQSPHNFGLAVDLCPMDAHGTLWWDAPDDTWHVMADEAKKLGLEPGYYFKSIVDKPHFQDPAWKDAQALWRAGKLKVA